MRHAQVSFEARVLVRIRRYERLLSDFEVLRLGHQLSEADLPCRSRSVQRASESWPAQHGVGVTSGVMRPFSCAGRGIRWDRKSVLGGRRYAAGGCVG